MVQVCVRHGSQRFVWARQGGKVRKGSLRLGGLGQRAMGLGIVGLPGVGQARSYSAWFDPVDPVWRDEGQAGYGSADCDQAA